MVEGWASGLDLDESDVARRLSQSISRTAALWVVPVLQWSVSISGEPATESWAAKARGGATADLRGLIQQTSYCSSNC